MYPRSPFHGACAALVLLSLTPSVPAQALIPTITFAEGSSTIISGTHGYLPAAGIRLRECDIVRTGPRALVQVELDDGTTIVLGPDSRLLADRPYAGDPVVGPHFLHSGWMKITVPKRENAPPHRINTPHFHVMIDAGVAVLHIAADGGEFFVEQGSAVALFAKSGSPLTIDAGRTYSRKVEQERATLTDGVEPSFAKNLPRALRDTLPSMLAKVKEHNVQPKPAPDYSPADTDEWLKADPELRRCFVDVRIRSAQEALARNGFKVGPTDGLLGPRTQSALREFQRQRGLTPSGQLDNETLKALDVADRP
jgi:hypothetical protein